MYEICDDDVDDGGRGGQNRFVYSQAPQQLWDSGVGEC